MSLLSRLGLRAGVVAAIMLEDLDWRRGELVVHGQAGHAAAGLADLLAERGDL